MQSRRSCQLGAVCPAAPATGPPGRPTAPAGCAAAPPGPGGTARTWRPWQPGWHERRGRNKRPWRCSPGSRGSSPRVPGASPVSGHQLRSWCPRWELSEREKERCEPAWVAECHQIRTAGLSYSADRLRNQSLFHYPGCWTQIYCSKRGIKTTICTMCDRCGQIICQANPGSTHC